ncbi:Uncharacterised protein [Bordetella bronchiseptica]|nr:Uncharacterised protein [Bordetella bronchiseptica]
MARHHHDLDLAGVEHDGQARVVAHAAVHGAAVQVYAVEQQLDPGGQVQGRAGLAQRRHRHLAAQGQGHGGAHAGRRGLLRGLRVADGVERHVLQALVQDLGQHRGGVHGAARTGIVVVVEQHHRSVLDGLGARDGGRQRLGVEHPVGASAPGGLEQLVAVLLGLRQVGIGAHHRAQPRLADVGMRKADEHRGGDHAFGLQRLAARLQRFVGFGMRALAHDVRQHRLVGPAHDGLDLAAQRAGDGVGRAQPGGADIDVRIGVKARDDGSVAHDVVVDVGVHVQRHAHRDGRGDVAQAAQQIAFGVFHAFGHHGAVQVQQDGVEAAAARLVQHQAAQALVRGAVGRRAGPGLRRHRHDDFGAFAARHLDIAAQAAVGVLVGAYGALAGQDLGAAAEKPLQRGGNGRERIGLVLDHRQQPTHGVLLVVRNSWRRAPVRRAAGGNCGNPSRGPARRRSGRGYTHGRAGSAPSAPRRSPPPCHAA